MQNQIKMRKVIFTVWVKGVRENGALVEGTNKFSDPKEGVFHEWGLDSDEGASYTVGIVETADGMIHLVSTERIQFTS